MTEMTMIPTPGAALSCIAASGDHRSAFDTSLVGYGAVAPLTGVTADVAGGRWTLGLAGTPAIRIVRKNSAPDTHNLRGHPRWRPV